ncbi:MAG: hypothetical protein IJ153_00605 [Clostridia bacterium]|nr:hypothetical protein [Clostridia bacterium]
MYFTKKKMPLILLALLLLLSCLPVFSLAESADIQEITVPNRPVKGLIQVQKQGPVLTGFNEHEDPFGNTVHTPMYGKGAVSGAVFEVRAVEDIVGKDGTLWFKADEVAATLTTKDGEAETDLLPLGHYYVTEVSAPEGYIFDSTRYDVLLEARDHVTEKVSVCVIAVNDFMPARISLQKEKEILNTETDREGMTHTTLKRVPGEGFVFGLYNGSPIAYAGGTLEADTLLATAVSDKNGSIRFSGQFPHGKYCVRELSGPEGWKKSDVDMLLSISDEYAAENQEIVIDLGAPIVNELIHSDVRVSKTDLTGTDYLPHTLIEVKNAEDKTVLRDYTGDDGYLPPFPAVPGKYTYREVLAPEGYELCVTELEFAVNAEGQIEGKATVADDYTRFSLLKVDAYHKPLSGVEFGLFREDGTKQATAVSDEKGLVTFEKIPYGIYTIQETKTLTGYLKNFTKVPITIDGTFVNPAEPIATLENCQSEILIEKVDQNNTALQGAEFGLYDESGKLVMTAVSDAEGMARFVGADYGKYTIRELSAPDGYLKSLDVISVTIDEGYTNTDQPAATVIDPEKKIMCIKADTSGRPIPGVAFSLYNAATMEKAETAVSDKDGVIIFRSFDYGDWIIREDAAPEGYSRMEDIRFQVSAGWTQPKPILCVNIPNHYEFQKTDSSGNPLVGAKFRLEDESGKELGTYASGKDGMVEIKDLKPGTYFIREIETLEGYSVSGEVIKLKLDEYYVVSEKLRQFVNYTTIQTGVHLAVTGVMWAGIALMVISGTVGILKKRRLTKTK